jgi:cell division protein ZapA (FtsZ GTPase activity inhibitor)
MEDKPGHNGKSPVLQKLVEKLLLISAFLAIAFFIILSLLVFGATLDTLRLLLSGILESLISVLLIFILRHQLFGSLDKFPSKEEELEQIGKVVDAQLEPIRKKQDTIDARLTNIEKELKKREQEIKASEKRVKQDIRDVQKDTIEALSELIHIGNTIQEKRIKQIEDHMSLTHSK